MGTLAAAHRSVRIRILVPRRNIDAKTVRLAFRVTWDELLMAEIATAEYQPTMFHMKSLVVEDNFVSVGSTNFDNRFFLLNDEANLNVISPDWVQTMTALLDNGLGITSCLSA